MLDLSQERTETLLVIREALVGRVEQQKRFLKDARDRVRQGKPLFQKVHRNPLEMKGKKVQKKAKQYGRFVYCHEFSTPPDEIIRRTNERIKEIDTILDMRNSSDQ